MRIVSWNVNGIRSAEKKGFVEWARRESPDMLCIQETKAEPGQLSEDLRGLKTDDGTVYRDYWASAKRKGYSGTAIYSKTEPLSVSTLGVAAFDEEGRVLQADYGDFVLICAYFPNSQDAGARLGYKLDFCAAMLELCNTLVARGRNLVLCGDYNIAHTSIDLARPAENEGNAGYLPEERAWMDTFTTSGYADTFREQHPGEPDHYSWWSYRVSSRLRNVGWRLDYHCVNRPFMDRVEKSTIRSDVLGSDHCPVEILLKP
jgi:exodeoxyribonuclease-3